MAGLNSLISDTTASTTTLPSWYDTAQQNIVSQAQSGAAQVPQLQNTVAGGAIQNLSGAQNPFFTAQGQLAQIGSGAANPWITDTTTGQVTPNTQTALGGLFQAQNQQLNQLMPTAIAPAQAGAIGSGNFGSLRGQTAVNTAKANALADLQAKQFAAALQNQQTGVNAAQGLSNVGSQGTSTMTTLGQAQQASPLTAVSDLAQILGAVRAPATVTQSTQLSPLSQIGSLASAVGGTNSGLNAAIKAFTGGNYSSLAGLIGSGLSTLFNSGSSMSPMSNEQIQSLISGGGVAAMTPGDLNTLLSSGAISRDQYNTLADAMDSASTPVVNPVTDSSQGYATDDTTSGITADTPLATDTLGILSGGEE